MKRNPTLLQAILPILVLVGMIVVNVFLIEDDPLDGPSQIALIFAAIVAGACAMFNGVTWEEISKKIENTIASAITSIIILLVIGMLAGSWMISGVIPSMIHYGLFILKPSYFLPATVLIASIVSVATGSSWSTIATVGVALLSIGNALGFSSPMVAGAIISGAYFGDKISPMSDTTNLASATARTNLFTHIKYMLHTSVPAILITLIIFLIISLSSGASSEINAGELQRVIKSNFNVNPLLFIVPVLVIYLIVKKVPAVITLLTGSILAAIFAVIFQGDLLERMTDG
ncbi:MAG: sodium:proton antiporter, partial [Bacteroidales bacterium]|nr:sodium:proton antiporter [Bacteroidales bacterium]